MPQSRNSETPPKVMTWGSAMPVIAVAVVFDLIRMFFEMFWFFGPALAAAYCASKASDWVGSLWGLTTIACGAAATVIGAVGIEVIAPFGVVMAMAVGFAGFLVLGLWTIMANSRIFKASATGAFQLVASFGVSEIPFVGALPAFTIILWKLYKNQIHVETEALRKWEKEQAAVQAQERQQQAAQIMQGQQAQVTQAEQQEAANDEVYAEAEQKKESDEMAPDEKYEPVPARAVPRLATVPNYTGTTQRAANDDQYTQKKVA